MRWATRPGVHVDRAACAWLIRTHIDREPEFSFVDDPVDAPPGAVCFDMPGVELGHHAGECSFETMLRRYDLTDPVLWRMAQAVHEADLDDERYDAREAAGLDVLVRGLALLGDDARTLAATGPMFDGLYEYHPQAILLGHEPA
jgi:hypothetical protein